MSLNYSNFTGMWGLWPTDYYILFLLSTLGNAVLWLKLHALKKFIVKHYAATRQDLAIMKQRLGSLMAML